MAERRLSEAGRQAIVGGALTRAIEHRLGGLFSFDLEQFLRDRFGRLLTSDVSIILGLSQRAQTAGEMAQRLPRDKRGFLKDIPIVRSMPDEFWEGARVAYTVIVPWDDPVTGITQEWRMRLLSDRTLSLSDIELMVNEQMLDWFSQSPPISTGPEFPGLSTVQEIRIIEVIRRY